MKSYSRILIVDDNADYRHSTAVLLAAHGYQTFVASNGVEALAIAELESPEVVLLDIGLPGFGGLEVARLIQRVPSMADAVIIAVSGRDGPDDIARSIAAGCLHHLGKPLDFAQLDVLLAGISGYKNGVGSATSSSGTN